MDTLAKIGRAERRIVKVQRRLWLAQLLMWPTVLLTGAGVVAAVALVVRRRSRGGRHELPETPGAHRADGDAAGTDGQLPHLQPPGA
ncbi:MULTISPECIES: hypothetical protein [Mycobacteriaceae]|uniref:hypothetical protein n=1 Tax=Mycobacteriaceae TaxID=1762 RepID=UPI0007FFF1F9|nr:MULTISPECIES: hypothetical protein [Mycobacteriaceae]MCK0177194.1 hypothetical protein [Mycolicibacterium sp. F2034L]OBB59512.1 hypothetical protein A5757_13150 [Mycobacterium sp. 852013-51886_SCH5428379]